MLGSPPIDGLDLGEFYVATQREGLVALLQGQDHDLYYTSIHQPAWKAKVESQTRCSGNPYQPAIENQDISSLLTHPGRHVGRERNIADDGPWLEMAGLDDWPRAPSRGDDQVHPLERSDIGDEFGSLEPSLGHLRSQSGQAIWIPADGQDMSALPCSIVAQA